MKKKSANTAEKPSTDRLWLDEHKTITPEQFESARIKELRSSDHAYRKLYYGDFEQTQKTNES